MLLLDLLAGSRKGKKKNLVCVSVCVCNNGNKQRAEVIAMVSSRGRYSITLVNSIIMICSGILFFLFFFKCIFYLFFHAQ